MNKRIPLRIIVSIQDGTEGIFLLLSGVHGDGKKIPYLWQPIGALDSETAASLLFLNPSQPAPS